MRLQLDLKIRGQHSKHIFFPKLMQTEILSLASRYITYSSNENYSKTLYFQRALKIASTVSV
ncbi:hypothetical protein ES332_A08G144600v1 [Gossypium tomentosum]|uniref:Uncharacterized protein n=1 Tax=Gossypium tomentosum TaxID=34277 RepID=A0A5D2PHJ9_GOSTO|nr:hypothetical protein ES332_A08G144600v1 [Gossypium tomentosum]